MVYKTVTFQREATMPSGWASDNTDARIAFLHVAGGMATISALWVYLGGPGHKAGLGTEVKIKSYRIIPEEIRLRDDVGRGRP
jgi:hypothetical protein